MVVAVVVVVVVVVAVAVAVVVVVVVVGGGGGGSGSRCSSGCVMLVLCTCEAVVIGGWWWSTRLSFVLPLSLIPRLTIDCVCGNRLCIDSQCSYPLLKSEGAFPAYLDRVGRPSDALYCSHKQCVVEFTAWYRY